MQNRYAPEDAYDECTYVPLVWPQANNEATTVAQGAMSGPTAIDTHMANGHQ
ncbi:hypothetical protein H4R18_004684 [Coemansia javaensis]|uniref:Uncharacterized protein n=1 Tax=Coemansia javaensis TaxID=2761396 RepID=A0A9W8LFX7_9FUNG|nr:hypothetical protein H4R18_004684 [Coemansia javaensis]